MFLHRLQDMVATAFKSEVLFEIVGVGSVFVLVCVAAAVCYTCHRRNRKSKGDSSGKEGELIEGTYYVVSSFGVHLDDLSTYPILVLAELAPQTFSARNAPRKTEDGVPRETKQHMEK